MTPQSLSDAPEVLDVQEVPSDEVRIVPDPPTVTKVLFPKVSPARLFFVLEVLLSQEVPSEEVRMVSRITHRHEGTVFVDNFVEKGRCARP